MPATKGSLDLPAAAGRDDDGGTMSIPAVVIGRGDGSESSWSTGEGDLGPNGDEVDVTNNTTRARAR